MPKYKYTPNKNMNTWLNMGNVGNTHNQYIDGTETRQNNPPRQRTRTVTPAIDFTTTPPTEFEYPITTTESITATDITVQITVNNTQTHTQTNEYNNTKFRYQPSTLWIQTDTASFPVMQTPYCTTGFTASNTVHNDAYSISEQFWSKLLTTYDTATTQDNAILTVTDTDTPIHERHHLNQLLITLFSPHHVAADHSKLLLTYAYTHHR